MDETQLIAALLEAGDRLANVIANSVPAKYRGKAILHNALSQWYDAAEAASGERSAHAIWCCVDHPGTACGDQCPACAGPLNIDYERCACGYDARVPAALEGA